MIQKLFWNCIFALLVGCNFSEFEDRYFSNLSWKFIILIESFEWHCKQIIFSEKNLIIPLIVWMIIKSCTFISINLIIFFFLQWISNGKNKICNRFFWAWKKNWVTFNEVHIMTQTILYKNEFKKKLIFDVFFNGFWMSFNCFNDILLAFWFCVPLSLSLCVCV